MPICDNLPCFVWPVIAAECNRIAQVCLVDREMGQSGWRVKWASLLIGPRRWFHPLSISYATSAWSARQKKHAEDVSCEAKIGEGTKERVALMTATLSYQVTGWATRWISVNQRGVHRSYCPTARWGRYCANRLLPIINFSTYLSSPRPSVRRWLFIWSSLSGKTAVDAIKYDPALLSGNQNNSILPVRPLLRRKSEDSKARFLTRFPLLLALPLSITVLIVLSYNAMVLEFPITM